MERMSSQAPTSDADPSAMAGALGKVKTHGLKYSAVSVVNVVVGQGLLFLFTGRGIGPTISNVLAVSISAVPAYFMNRAWVWGRKGRSSFKREILPFWGFAFLGLVLSALAVTIASAAVGYDPKQLDTIESWKRLIPNIANISAFGILWVVKFFVLDAVIFGKGHHGADEVILDDLGPDTDTAL